MGFISLSSLHNGVRVHVGRDIRTSTTTFGMTGMSFQQPRVPASSSLSSLNLSLDTNENKQLPTLEQAAKDSFMQQISHAGDIVAYLNNNDHNGGDGDSQVVVDLLTAQLSHVDGLRGFFATYLTGEGDETAADQEKLPLELVRAMENVDQKQLIDIACMNVVMPTAMMSMHADADLAANAAKTAKRAKIVLQELSDSGLVEENSQGILAAVTDDDKNDSDNAKYWREFVEKYQYGKQQKEDIAKTIAELC